MKDVSLVLPVYKAEKIIRNSVRIVEKELKKLKYDYEIIIADDGEEDKTHLISKKLSQSNKNITRIHSKKKTGRGKALKKAFKVSKGRIIAYMDIDLATNIKHLKQLINSINQGCDISTGSRLLKKSKVIGRTLKREIASRAYNFLVKLLLNSKISDHQCGFKAFNKKNVKKIINSIEDDFWFFDTEILVRAQKNGLKVCEFPVEWEDNKFSTTVNFFGDIKDMGLSIIKLRNKLSEKK